MMNKRCPTYSCGVNRNLRIGLPAKVLTKAGIVFLLLGIFISFGIGTKSCIGRNDRKTKSGSSNSEWPGINAPSNLTATVLSYSQVNLLWQDKSNNEDGFQIERSTNPTTGYLLLATVYSNMVSYSDTSALRDNTYYYRVRAYMTTGDVSNYSNVASATTDFNYSWLSPFIAVGAGGFHSIALANNGILWAWGNNEYYQLGLGDTDNRTVPNMIETDFNTALFNNVSSLSAGYSHNIVRKTNGTLWGWGSNGFGQLGTGDTLSTDAPIQIGSESDWSTIVAGGGNTFAVKSNTLWVWGYNVYGQLGLGDSGEGTERNTPTQIGTDTDWSMIARGKSHTVALKTNRTLWTWGNNVFGQLGMADTITRITPSQVGTQSDWSFVETGGFGLAVESHTIAIKTPGTLWTWGTNICGQLGLGDNGYSTYRTTPTQVNTQTDWSAGTAGMEHTVCLKTNGTLWSFGRNNSGQLGLGDIMVDRNTPTQMGIQSDWSVVTAGEFHTIGLKTNQTVWVWGWNVWGQLGLDDTIDRNIPCLLGSPRAPASLNLTVASSTQINLSWSDNSFNELGFLLERSTDGVNYALLSTLNVNTISYSDTGLSTGTLYYYRIKAYNAIGESAYTNEANAIPVLLAPVLMTVGIISSTQIDLSWTDLPDETGFKVERKIGVTGTYQEIGETEINITIYSDITPSGFTPNTTYYYRIRAYNTYMTGAYSNEKGVMLSGNYLAVAGGGSHTIAIKTPGTLWSTGWNSYGQLGLGDTVNRKTLSQIGTQSDWSKIAAGETHTAALKMDGTLWSWGSNMSGRLGLGDTINRNTPGRVGAETDWSVVVCGRNYSVSIKNNGYIWTWGDNWSGQLGLGDTIERRTPSQIEDQTDWTKIAVGQLHTMGLKNNGSIWSWGNNNSGQLGLGNTIKRTAPVQVGNQTDWSVIMGGAMHTIGIKNDGTLWGWGDNWYGQLGFGDTTKRVTPSLVGTQSDWSWIAGGGGYHTIALKTNNTIWSWGYNGYGQLGLGDSGFFGTDRNTPTQVGMETDWSSVAGGYYHSIGFKTTDTLWAWGQNNYGLLGLGDTIDRNVPTLIGE